MSTLSADQRQPTFCLHNGQIMLIKNKQEGSPLVGMTKNHLAEQEVVDDDLSCTSSNMSDGDSWTTDESSLSDDDDDENDMTMDISTASTYGKLTAARGNRSTVSLSAAMQAPESKPQQQGLTSFASSARLAKAKSMLDLSSAADNTTATTSSTRKPPAMQAMQRVSAQDGAPGSQEDAVVPDDHLCKLLDTPLDCVPYDSLGGGYFLQPTPEHIAAWDHDLLRAIRTHDLPLLRKMHQEQGKPLQASNQFGESIMHVCVRRGTSEIMRYLLERGVSPRVHCDYGRTPLHDALWTFENPESLRMAAILISKCPEMLLVTDKRGFTPLNYVPRDRWSDCCRFLDRCLPLLARLRNNGRVV